MKYLVIIIVLYFLSSLATAQNSTYPDRIKLINGSLMKGTIIEDKVGEYIEIMIIGEKIVKFEYDEVLWIKDGGYKHSGYQVKEPGCFIRTEIGIAIDKVEQPPWTNAGSYNNEYFTFHIINGFRLKPSFQPGIGVGIDNYPTITVFPIYLSLKGDLIAGKVTHFYQIDIGSGFGRDRKNDFRQYDQVKAGIMFHPSVGLQLNTYKKASYYLAIGYKLQKAKLENTRFDVFTSTERTFQNLTVRVGLEF